MGDSKGGRLRVLLLDDEVKILRAYERALGDEFEIIGVSTAAEAIKILESDLHLDAAIFDVIGVDGYRVAARARELRPELPIAMLSGSREAEDVNPAALARPPIPFLAKADLSTDDVRAWLRTATWKEPLEERHRNPSNGPLRGIRVLLIYRTSPPGKGKGGGETLQDALHIAGADVFHVGTSGVSDHLTKIGAFDIAFVDLFFVEPTATEGGVGVRKEIKRARPSLPVVLFRGQADDPMPELAIATGHHRRLIDLVRLTGAGGQMRREPAEPEPRLVPFVLAIVAAARACEAERCLQAELEPIVVPRHLPNPFPLGDFLKDVRRLILRLVRSEYETEAKAARVLDQPLSRFPLRKASEPSGLRRRLLESDARPDFSRVLLYSPTAVDEALLRALREAGFHPFWEPKPYLVTKRIHDERIGLAVLQADESREIIAAKAIVRLRPDMPVFLTGMGTLVTSIVATGFGLRDRLFGEVAPDALATLLDATRQRIALTEIREREYDLAGRPSFDDPTPSDEDGSTPERSFELDVDRVLRAIERAVIVIGLDEYGSERRAYEPLGFRSLSSLQRRMSALGIPPRPRSRTPPNVPQVP